jgi:hypothetical protein
MHKAYIRKSTSLGIIRGIFVQMKIIHIIHGNDSFYLVLILILKAMLCRIRSVHIILDRE